MESYSASFTRPLVGSPLTSLRDSSVPKMLQPWGQPLARGSLPSPYLGVPVVPDLFGSLLCL